MINILNLNVYFMKLTKQILEAIQHGIKLALDDYQDIEPNSSVSSNNDVIDAEDVIQYKLDLDKYTVDLELPSGTLWCKYNIGVNPMFLNTPKNYYGNYYAWGEIVPNKSDGYNWKTYHLIKYNEEDHLNKLQFMDDAAYQNIHLHDFKFHIPTKEQFEELLKYTTNKWIENYQNIDGLNGRLFKGENGNELFMPAAGSYDNSNLNDVSYYGNYWSSSLYIDNHRRAWHLYFDDEEIDILSSARCNGFNVRPVLNLK